MNQELERLTHENNTMRKLLSYHANLMISDKRVHGFLFKNTLMYGSPEKFLKRYGGSIVDYNGVFRYPDPDNNGSEIFNYVDNARKFNDLRSIGVSEREIAKMEATSKSSVHRLLSIIPLGDEILNFAKFNDIQRYVLFDIVDCKDNVKKEHAINQLLSGKIKTRKSLKLLFNK